MIPRRAGEPMYGDFSSVEDYQAAVNSVMQAQDQFMALPAQIRKRFDNDPAQLIAFMNDPGNASEAIELGLIEEPASGEKAAPVASEAASEPPEELPASGG